MDEILRKHKDFWTKERRESLYAGVLFLLAALAFQSLAGNYSVRKAANFNFVGDLFLDNLPTVNLTRIVVDGGFLAILLGVILLIAKPEYILFTLKVVAFFILIRSFFVTLTHIGIYPNQIALGDGPIDKFYMLLNMQDGFFFSGHTGLAFLGALIVWQEKLWRYVFLAISIIFAATVLLAHVHYSIDVFAAPFMTYAIFKLAQQEFFRKDYATLREGVIDK